MVDHEELARLQDRLLELLHEETDSAVIRDRLEAEFGDSGFRDFIQQMEPRMIEVAAELVKKWGRRSKGCPYT
jgi:hypothetical protein